MRNAVLLALLVFLPEGPTWKDRHTKNDKALGACFTWCFNYCWLHGDSASYCMADCALICANYSNGDPGIH